MDIFIQDTQVVAETDGQLVEFFQQGPIEMLVFMTNDGANTINYRWQQFTGTDWQDMGSVGSDYYNTLIAAQSRSLKVTSVYPRLRIMGNATGGSILDFSVSRIFTRSSGGACPILAM